MRMSLDAWEVAVTPESRAGTPAPPEPVASGGAASVESSTVKRVSTASAFPQDEATSFRFLVNTPVAEGSAFEKDSLECTYAYTVRTAAFPSLRCTRYRCSSNGAQLSCCLFPPAAVAL